MNNNSDLALTFPGDPSGTPIEIKGPTGTDGLLSKDFTLADIVNLAIPILFTIAGLILGAMFIWGGFKLLTSMGDEQAKEEAKGMITNAVIGFAIVFTAYWVTQLFAKLFGIPIF